MNLYTKSPVRVRAKTLLLYYKTKHTYDEHLNALKQCLQITCNSQWEYFAKFTTVDSVCYIIIYI
jgi:hypothetical protein